jgi:hypothetical protein
MLPDAACCLLLLLPAAAHCWCCQLFDVLCLCICKEVVVDERARLPGNHLYPVYRRQQGSVQVQVLTRGSLPLNDIT